MHHRTAYGKRGILRTILGVCGAVLILHQPALARIDLLASDEVSNAILRFHGTTGAYLGEFVKSGLGGLNKPHGLTFGPDGNLYVISAGTHEVLRYNDKGQFLDVFVHSPSIVFGTFTHLAFGSDGNLYIVESGSPSSPFSSGIRRFNGQTGQPTGTFANNFASPSGVATPAALLFQPQGHLLVTLEASRYGVVKEYQGPLDPSPGSFIKNFVPFNPFIGFPNNLSNAYEPADLASGPDSNLYVVSSYLYPPHDEDYIGAVLRYDGSSGNFIDDFVAYGPPLSSKCDTLAFGPVNPSSIQHLFVGSGGNIYRFIGPGAGFLSGVHLPDGQGDAFINHGSYPQADIRFKDLIFHDLDPVRPRIQVHIRDQGWVHPQDEVGPNWMSVSVSATMDGHHISNHHIRLLQVNGYALDSRGSTGASVPVEDIMEVEELKWRLRTSWDGADRLFTFLVEIDDETGRIETFSTAVVVTPQP